MDAEELEIYKDEETVIEYLRDCIASGCPTETILKELVLVAPYHNIAELLKKIV